MKGAKMAYSKIYTRVSWVNEPSTATPLNDNNLNNMDATIDILDSRIVNIDGRVEQLAGYEPRVIEYATQAENSKKDSEAYAIGKRDGVDVISGDPAYHNNSKYYSEQAGTSATNAATSETNAGTSESNAATSASNAEAYAVGQRNGSDVPSTDPTYHNNAKYYSEQASTDATSADASATSASGSASDAEAYAVGKRGGTDVPSTDPTYQNNSKYYSEQAGTSATSAIQSASDADDRAEDSEAYAIGKRNGVDVTSGDPTYHNNSKYYSELAGTSEVNAALSEANASASELNAADSESDAGAWAIGERNGQPVPSTDPTYQNNSKFYAQEAGNSANAAATSESNALASENNAAISENNAAISETYAATSESNAEAWAIGERRGVPVNYDDPTYHNNSKWFSQQSANSAASADSSAADALGYRNLSESYAVGTYGVVREGDATDNSKYYSQLSAQSAIEANDILDEIKGYQGMIVPDLYLDAENGILYIEDLAAKTVDFAFDADECALYWGFVVTP